MRTDDRGGFIWKYNGRQIAMTSGDPAEDGSITYTGRSRSSNEDLTFTLRYSVDEQKQLVVTASVTNNKDTEQPVDKLSLNLGFNTIWRAIRSTTTSSSPRSCAARRHISGGTFPPRPAA